MQSSNNVEHYDAQNHRETSPSQTFIDTIRRNTSIGNEILRVPDSGKQPQCRQMGIELSGSGQVSAGSTSFKRSLFTSRMASEPGVKEIVLNAASVANHRGYQSNSYPQGFLCFRARHCYLACLKQAISLHVVILQPALRRQKN